MLSLCEKALTWGLMLKYHPGVHTIEVQTKSGLYWARVWANEEGRVFCVADMNGQMIEDAEEGGVFLDIGANVGRYTIPMATKAKTVWAFEPEPKNYAKLVEHTSQYPNIIRVNNALSNQVGITKMNLCGRWGEHTMVTGLIEEVKEVIEVKTTTVDLFCEAIGIKDIHGIKVDVEGAEALVFEGMIETLKNNNPLIALETHQTADLRIVQDILHETGYEIMASSGQIITELLPDIQVIAKRSK